jgi:hypothetical protein
MKVFAPLPVIKVTFSIITRAYEILSVTFKNKGLQPNPSMKISFTIVTIPY